MPRKWKNGEPMKELHDKLILGKGSSFVKSHLSRLPRTDEVWEADIQPMSVSGWNARRHGELWLGMVLTRLEDFHLALQAHEDSPTVNDLAHLLAKAMEQPWVMGATTARPDSATNQPAVAGVDPPSQATQDRGRNPRGTSSLGRCRCRVRQKAEGNPGRTGRADHHSSPGIRRGVSGFGPLGQDPGAHRDWSRRGARNSWSVPWTVKGSSSRARPASPLARR